jgi:hypothetical protein
MHVCLADAFGDRSGDLVPRRAHANEQYRPGRELAALDRESGHGQPPLRGHDGKMVQADARSGGVGEIAMPGALLGRRSPQCRRAVVRGRHPEAAPKGAAEDFVAAEARGRGDLDHPFGAAGQPGCGPLEAQPQHVLLRGLADHLPERPVEVERRPAGARRQRVERQVVVETTVQVAEQLQDVALGGHRLRNDRRAAGGGLTFLAIRQIVDAPDRR